MADVTFEPFAAGTTAGAGKEAGSIDPRLSRTNYFDGQLLTARDLTRDQIYLDERLLELGQALGSGVVQGLELELADKRYLQVKAGLGIAPSGRVLQLKRRLLQLDLLDSALIADLNHGRYRRFNPGLFAVALSHAEVVKGVAEVYPSDLSTRRLQADSFGEGVEVILIPLPVLLPQGDPLLARAALAQQMIAPSGEIRLGVDEAVPLGVLAVVDGRPAWLDRGLLRRRFLPRNTGNAYQLNLAAHYRELFDEVQLARRQRGWDSFSAEQYFRILPPYGPLPKGSLDPVTGRQSYFPKGYEVSIAPVRRSEVATLMEEALRLPAIDLQRDPDVDLMVLVPMSDDAFALRGRQLEKSAPEPRRLPSLGWLTLRFYTQPAVHHLDTDEAVWKAIWAEAVPSELLYVRRPPRAAETNVSGIILASGFNLVPSGTFLPEDLSKKEAELHEAQDRAARAEADLKGSREQAESLKGELEKLKAQLEQLAQAGANEAALKEALQETAKLREQLTACRARVSDLEPLGERVKHAEEDAARTHRDLETAQTEREEARKLAEELRLRLAAPDPALAERLKELEKERDDGRIRITELEKASRDADLMKAAAEQKLAEKENERLGLQQKWEEATANLKKREEEITTLGSEMEKATREREERATEVDQLGRELAGAREQATAAEAARVDALVKMQQAAEQAAQERTALMAELTQSRAELKGSQQEFATAKERAAAADHDKELALQARQQAEEALGRSRGEFENQLNTVNAAHQEELQRKETELAAVKTERDQAAQARQQAEAELTRSRGEFDQQLNSVQAAHQQELQQKEAEAAALRTERDQAVQLRQQGDQELGKLRADLETQLSAEKAAHQQESQLRQQAEAATVRVRADLEGQLKAANDAHRQELDRVQRERQQAVDDLKSVQVKLQDSEKERVVVAAQRDTLANDLKNSQAEVAARLVEIKNLQARIKPLRPR